MTPLRVLFVCTGNSARSLHWGYTDPASVEGTDAERLEAFQRVFTQLGERVRQFVVVAGRATQRSTATG